MHIKRYDRGRKQSNNPVRPNKINSFQCCLPNTAISYKLLHAASAKLLKATNKKVSEESTYNCFVNVS